MNYWNSNDWANIPKCEFRREWARGFRFYSHTLDSILPNVLLVRVDFTCINTQLQSDNRSTPNDTFETTSTVLMCIAEPSKWAHRPNNWWWNTMQLLYILLASLPLSFLPSYNLIPSSSLKTSFANAHSISDSLEFHTEIRMSFKDRFWFSQWNISHA